MERTETLITMKSKDKDGSFAKKSFKIEEVLGLVSKEVEEKVIVPPLVVHKRKLEQIDKNDPIAQYNMGIFCMENYLFQEAKAEFHKALELDPTLNSSVLANLKTIESLEANWCRLSDNEVARSSSEMLEETVSLDFKDTNLREVIDFLSGEAQANLVLDEPHLAQLEMGKITIYLQNASLRKALDTLVATKGLAYRAEEHLIWISTPDSVQRLVVMGVPCVLLMRKKE